MTISTIISLFPALLGMAVATLHPDGTEVRTLVLQNEIIMRIPVQVAPRAVEWVERDGPECLPSSAIRGAALSGAGDVDFLLGGRARVRAKLSDDCPGLDFYNGFYLAPEDERICAGRDSIRSRIGGSCPIDRFRRLSPVRR